MSSFFILSLIASYFGLLILISYLTTKNSDQNTFYNGNKQAPWYLVAYGMIGASLSGITFISIPGVVGNVDGLNGQFSYMQVVLGYLLGYFVIAQVLLPLYYKLNLTSIYTFLEQRFGQYSYKTGAFFFLLSRTIGAAFRLFLVATVLQLAVFQSWGVPFEITVVITILLIWIYTFKGGIKTIIYTDTLQTTFMLLSVILTVYYIAQEFNWGATELVSAIDQGGMSKWFFWDWKSPNNFFKQFFSGAFIAIVMTGLDQDMMQKNLACKNLGEAKKNVFTFSIILFFVNLLFLTLGALLYLYAANKGIEIPSKTDQLFPMLALNNFTPLIGGLFILGIIAAAYSSADSALTALTTSFCIDFLGFEKKGTNIKTRTYVHIGFSVLLLLVIILFNRINNDSVISELFKVAGYTYGPLLGLFAFGMITKRPVRDRLVPIICILSPTICYFINKFSVELLNGYKFGFEILILNGFLTFVGLYILSVGKVRNKQ